MSIVGAGNFSVAQHGECNHGFWVRRTADENQTLATRRHYDRRQSSSRVDACRRRRLPQRRMPHLQDPRTRQSTDPRDCDRKPSS